jgi:hypothetical protein
VYTDVALYVAPIFVPERNSAAHIGLSPSERKAEMCVTNVPAGWKRFH